MAFFVSWNINRGLGMGEFRDVHGNRIARRVGDRIWGNYGNWVYEIRGDRI